MRLLQCRIKVFNPLTMKEDLYYNVPVFDCRNKISRKSVIQLWNADRSGTVEAEVYDIVGTRRSEKEFPWKIAE